MASIAARVVWVAGILLASFAMARAQRVEPAPDTVRFAGPDGVTLVGFLFTPTKAVSGKGPAIVMMHGRAGAYSSAAHGVYDATTLSRRHRLWGRLWADEGYIALLVDSFGPRGFAGGFPVHSYADRPEAVNEVTVRPLDAEAARAFLASRADVDPTRIGLQGWSNGGSATLATVGATSAGTMVTNAGRSFAGALAFYPACGLHDRFQDGYRPQVPMRVLIGDADEEVSFRRCQDLVERSRRDGGDIAITVYPGATHGFDDPGRRRQSIEANSVASEAATAAALAFMRARFAR